MDTAINLHYVDYAIMVIYVLFVVGIGFALKRYMKNSSEFLTSGRSIPAWITGLAFISANLGALELVGMAASGAKYGISTCHFYWVGAIPAIVFLAVFMMPFYYGSKARSVPEYLNMRFDGRVRCLNSIAFAVMTVFASGISMNALAKLLEQLLGWNYHVSLWICSGVVLMYVLKGGLTSAIYTEVLQFFMILLGFAPVVYLGLKDVGGWSTLHKTLQAVPAHTAELGLQTPAVAYDANAWTSSWLPLLAGPAHNPMGVDWFAMVFGLGFVLSFGYWCTNFLVVQRAMAAKNMSAARRTPLIGAVPKMFLPLLVILPGMIAVGLALTPNKNYHLPTKQLDSTVCMVAAKVVTDPASATLDADTLQQKVNAAVGKDAGDYKLSGVKLAEIAKLNVVAPIPEKEMKARMQAAVTVNDYDLVILSLVSKYCPLGLLGLALTALLASFMSGMAGNVTAFNTIWTYDLYQAYIAPKKSDDHYLWMGRATTVAGIVVSIGCAYFARQFNNAMDVIQLVFGFVNAPLFATFLLGMFWKRITATAAFLGLFGGILTSVVFHGMTIAKGDTVGFVKGAFLTPTHATIFESSMAKNFWLASFAFIGCFVFTVIISMLTKQAKTDEDLKGLVYSLTPKVIVEEKEWWLRPGILGTVLLAVCVALNWFFW